MLVVTLQHNFQELGDLCRELLVGVQRVSDVLRCYHHLDLVGDIEEWRESGIIFASLPNELVLLLPEHPALQVTVQVRQFRDCIPDLAVDQVDKVRKEALYRLFS